MFEQRYLTMAKACLKDNTPFGVCAIREGKEVGTPAVPFEIGTTAKIAEWDMQQLGVLQIVASGEARFRILEHRARKDGLLVGRVEVLPAESDGPIPAACEPAVRLLERVIEQHAGLFPPPHHLQSAAWVSARLAEILPLPLPAKQELLELDDARVRLERINALLRASAREES
ncbi:MAG TPA: LON peptidase substrate-binding domain-containing protein [Burkholderiales bacterium]|nr:LON peptidase substrate-binding domain-containing protein [Burkholderiales bacterium]